MSSTYHTIDHWSSNLSISSLPSNCFLSDVVVFDVTDSGELVQSRRNDLIAFAESALTSGTAEVRTRNLPVEAAAGIAIPIYRSGGIVSIVVMLARGGRSAGKSPLGVFEIWEPIGIYEEAALKSGFYGPLERFHNVSSFVRFEKGSGLPGQVWQQRCGVIHDNLRNHPGFLRAAGASAEMLRTAIGIPIAADDFLASAVLISSSVTPISRGMEVWKVRADSGEFELITAAYYDLGDEYELPLGTRCSAKITPFSRLCQENRALVTDDPLELLAGRNADAAAPGPASGLAIPFFDGSTLTSITLFLF
jgi:hypothetical protein